jgi:hypothetical protein
MLKNNTNTEDIMFLKDYCKENGVKIKWVASKIGLSYHHLLCCIAGKYNLSDEAKEKVYEITRGLVSGDEISKFKYIQKEKE